MEEENIMKKTMTAAIITKYGQQAVLQEVAMPTINANDVLVEIYAASINPIDFKTRDGKVKMLLHYDMPLILGSDFAGVVVQVGANVSHFKIGDAVYGRPRKTHIGTFAEYLAVDVADIAPKPKNLSFEEAASIPLVGLTTYQALHDIMQIKAQDKLLIQAGSGGIGTFAIQLAKTMGAYVATTTSTKNVEFVQALGADKVINYREENFEDVLKDYDYVYDTLGGEALAKAFQITKAGGKIVSLSGLPNERFAKENGYGWGKQKLFKLATRNLSKLEKRYQVSYHFLFMKPSGEQLAIITELIEAQKIKPIIDKVIAFENIAEAFSYSESGRARGKVIIKIKA